MSNNGHVPAAPLQPQLSEEQVSCLEEQRATRDAEVLAESIVQAWYYEDTEYRESKDGELDMLKARITRALLGEPEHGAKKSPLQPEGEQEDSNNAGSS